MRYRVEGTIPRRNLYETCFPLAQGAGRRRLAAACPGQLPPRPGSPACPGRTPPPLSDNVTVVHEELNYPRGLIFDADDNLYVVEAGRGGDTEVTAATCPDFDSPFMPYHVGMSGRVARSRPTVSVALRWRGCLRHATRLTG